MEENSRKIPQIENIPIAAKIVGIPVYSMRQLVLSGRIPAIRVGRRIFVNVDRLIEYLNSSKLTPDAEKTASGGRIAPIDLRR